MKRRWVLLLPLLPGLIFLSVGIAQLTDEGPAKELARVEALPRYTRWPLEPSGLRALVQGTLAASNPVRYRQFVAGDRARFDGYEDESPSEASTRWGASEPTRHQVEKWVHLETFSPALELRLEDGPVQLSQGYELRRVSHQVKDPLTGPLERTAEAGSGFFAGDLVTVEGELGPGRVVNARVLSGGDVAAFLADRRSSATATHVLGLVFTPLGAVLLLGWALILRRLWKS